MLRSTRLEVDLDLLAHNVRVTRRLLAEGPAARDGGPVRLAAVLKADAYGLGARSCAEVFLREGADLLAVACLPEAVELRRAFPDAPILVMGHTPTEYLERAVREGITPSIFDLEQGRELSRAARSLGTRAAAHVKVDTGMNRLGLKPGADTPDLLERLASLPALRLEGIFTHLALRSRDSDRAQAALFERVIREAGERGVRFPLRHACDSIGFLRYPEFRMDLIRAGAILYGVKPQRTPLAEAADIRTPFALRTRISRVRPLAPGENVGYDDSFAAPAGGGMLATLPVGYADGYRRCFSNRARVLVRGVPAYVVGLVCMDQCTVDVSGVPDAAEGDEVLLLGSGPEGEVPVADLADWAGTNRNEILCSLGRRLPRVYSRSGAPAGETDYLDRPNSPPGILDS